ncbi:ankyrin repeat domain-containing protein 31 [Gracilinanus agilis]|uniref:ankyrin repeat domain-containing protein 31 n=1 Tax=Gracilinanus agilis TaxID=191870 RepID=UPI001CFE8EA4|nr:ankyrin repeat domain-containing protein 31 [Gracilinanus agilis]
MAPRIRGHPGYATSGPLRVAGAYKGPYIRMYPATHHAPQTPAPQPQSPKFQVRDSPGSREARRGRALSQSREHPALPSSPRFRRAARVWLRHAPLRLQPSSSSSSSSICTRGARSFCVSRGCPRAGGAQKFPEGKEGERKGGIAGAGMEEEAVWGLDWDSDETIVEGSVTESELEDDELPLKRLFFAQDTSFISDPSFHSDLRRMYGEAASPEIHLVYKLREYLQEQMNKHMIKPNKQTSHLPKRLDLWADKGHVSSYDSIRNEMDNPLFSEEVPQDDLVLDSEWQNEHNYSADEEQSSLLYALNLSQIQWPSPADLLKSAACYAGLQQELFAFANSTELSDGDDSPEISLLSGAVITSYGTVEVKKKPSEKLKGHSVLTESLKEVALPSREIEREDSACEMLVPITEDSSGLSESILVGYPFKMNEIETKELLKPLSDLGSPKSMSPLDHLLICQEDVLSEDMQENEKNDALPAELLTALNTLSESVVESICQRMERGNGSSAENEFLETEPSISQTDNDCTQIGMNFEFQHSVQPFGQGPKLTEPLLKDITMQQGKEGLSSFGQETLTHQNDACSVGLRKEEDLNTMETTMAMETSSVLRRSARLKAVRAGGTPKDLDEVYKMPEEILQKTHSGLPVEYFRTQDPPFQNNSDEKSIERSKEQILSPYSSDEQLRKGRKTAKNRKSHRNISKVSSINRRDIYGESPLHKAAQADDSALVKKYIKLGGNVNLPDYAGWTALHEASVDGFYKTVLELLKGGADVNCKGMKQITPIYDAVLNGHYKVAELLLQNGADPLFRNDYGKCALDEASDPHMKQLLECYIPKPSPTPEQKKRNEPLLSEDMHPHQKQDCSPRKRTPYFNNENSRGIKENNTEIPERNKGNILKNKEVVNEDHQKISKNNKLISTRNKQSTIGQINANEPSKIHMQDISEPKNFVSTGKGKMSTIPKGTEISGRKSNIRIVPATPSKRIMRSIAHLETFCDLSEKSSILTSSAAPMPKNDLCHNSEDFSVFQGRDACENDITSPILPSQEEHGQSTGSADCQKEYNFSESGTAEPAESIPLSGLLSCEEAELPLVTEGNYGSVHHEKPLPCEANSYNNTNHKSENVTEWEKCFFSFVDTNIDSDNDSSDDGECISEGAALSKKFTCLVNDENQNHCEIDSKHEEESNSQQYLPSETQSLLQENGLQAAMTVSQQHIVNLSDSDCTVISERYVVNDGQNIEGTTSDVNAGQIPLASTRTPSMLDLSGKSGVATGLQNIKATAPDSFVNQTDEERVTNVREEESSQRTCSEKSQESHQKRTESTERQSREKEATNVERKQMGLSESEVTPNENVQSVKTMNEDLNCISQPKQGTEKMIPSQSEAWLFCTPATCPTTPQSPLLDLHPDKEMTDTVNREQNTERSHKEEKEKRNPEICVSRDLQPREENNQIKRKRQDHQGITYSEELSSSISTNKDLLNLLQQEDSPNPKVPNISEPSASGKKDTQVLPDKLSCKTTKVQKRTTKGKSRLHLAAKRGDLSLVKALIESGTQLNQKDNAGWTALHEAANKGFNEVLVELLKAGANVNSESLDGLLPIHNAVSGNHLKAAEILLQHGANPDQKKGDQKSALERAENEKMKKLLKSYSRNETREICHNKVPGTALEDPKRTTIAGTHEAICTILQDIEEKQENLLLFEIRTPEDADQYSEKMLQIKDIMDSVLAKQKKERDDLAKKYRASVESFKRGALREQLANLATRQKSLLMVAQKQKKLSQKIQNYKNKGNRSTLGVREELPDSRNSNEKDKGSDPPQVERTRQPGSVSVPVQTPADPTREIGWKTHGPPESRQEDSQNSDSCLSERGTHEKAAESQCVPFTGPISKRRRVDHSLPKTWKSRNTHGIKRVKLLPQRVTSSAVAEYLQEGNYTTVITAKGSKSLNPSAITETLNVLETTSATVRNNTHQPSTVCHLALGSCLLPGNTAKKTVSQDTPRTVSESLVQSFLTHQGNAGVDSGTLARRKLNQTESRPVGALADNRQINFSSEPANQNNKQEPLNSRAEMKMKKAQIKELISLGRIKPGNDVLEFKMQDATYKASILPNGKVKAKNGEIYQNPITWIKALLGSNISVTWKYVWNKVTYLGKELCKYITEEVPVLAEPNEVLQENQPCLPGPSSESSQNLTHYLQLNEILLISDQELLPCHIMEQYWKFYTTSKDAPF